MLSIDERVAFMEGRLVDQSALFADLRTGVSNLAQRVDQLEQRMDRRFEHVDGRFLKVEARLDHLAAEESKHFRWLVGLQVTTLITVAATVLGALAAR